jgi:formylglycine-generating enzyme required for sulfatase activity
VSEWCLDEYDPTYFAWSPDDNPQGPVEMRGVKVRRGGSWNSPWSNGFAVRRSHSASNLPYTGFGFRVVRELD